MVCINICPKLSSILLPFPKVGLPLHTSPYLWYWIVVANAYLATTPSLPPTSSPSLPGTSS